MRIAESTNMSLMSIINFLHEAVTDFLSKNCVSMAAAISFYALFSMFPLGLAVISVTGFIIGPEITANPKGNIENKA